jgi:hypothetical protein
LGETAVCGENYVQEALAKQAILAAMPEAQTMRLDWHFTGHLQSNKAKLVLKRFSLMHALDSLGLAQNLHKTLLTQPIFSAGQEKTGQIPVEQPALVQVNIGLEGSKFGLHPDELENFIKELQAFSLIDAQGLMCLPPYNEDAEKSRPYFIRLRQMRDNLQSALGIKLPHLSMGMSHDFEVAVEEGATIIRVGTDIFGQRLY